MPLNVIGIFGVHVYMYTITIKWLLSVNFQEGLMLCPLSQLFVIQNFVDSAKPMDTRVKWQLN